jgi:uncharacterized protein (DUF924 family)
MMPEDVLDFWFDPASEPLWFDTNEAFDRLCRERFGTLTQAALAGDLDGWVDHEEGSGSGTLALVIALDQLPRNVYRGDPRCYAGDAAALAHATAAILTGIDECWPDARRAFLYMPYQHAEDTVVQDRSVELFRRLGEESEWFKSAVEHRDIVTRFGRFPHRNALLCRESTEEERAFLRQPGSVF